jgi:hypothetical protein
MTASRDDMTRLQLLETLEHAGMLGDEGSRKGRADRVQMLVCEAIASEHQEGTIRPGIGKRGGMCLIVRE